MLGSAACPSPMTCLGQVRIRHPVICRREILEVGSKPIKPVFVGIPFASSR